MALSLHHHTCSRGLDSFQPHRRGDLERPGIDLGIEHFAYLSNGEIVENQRHLKHAEEKLKQVQQQLSRKKKGSKNRRKAKLKLAIAHEKLTNKRRDFLHKTSKKIAETYSFIALEKLNVKSMSKKENFLAKSIHDCSWVEFINMLRYKAEEAGSKVVFVNPANTTKQCSNCNLIQNKTLADRWHECICGLSIHRDHNAARNILKRATTLGTSSQTSHKGSSFATTLGHRESNAYGEGTSTQDNPNGQVSSMK